MDKQAVINHLKLQRHPLEGGYFRRTYESEQDVSCIVGTRKLLTSIYYMLTDDSPIGFLHKNISDIMHYYHKGEAIKYTLVSPDGNLSEVVLGPEIENGQQLQLLVPGGYWKASSLCSGEFSLISEAVSPGFSYTDNQLATHEVIEQAYPEIKSQLNAYIK
ncbi:hypothetical protein EDC56_1085 [Sinobacterium caligoides]|uniref:DUF985 domain-containing protein n=1 Tax=Sinobacterium caligoides TaxID=933926 RepID=A0A3N2E0D1_9GAMM|nr:cupin domain-containing protein [Sinobacterium caligoides]ROS05550.1 hypothetical protein EDC56_1085 [Sinobacterium caligoides]